MVVEQGQMISPLMDHITRLERRSRRDRRGLRSSSLWGSGPSVYGSTWSGSGTRESPIVLQFHPFSPTFPTPSSPSLCPKLQKHQQINKTHVQDISLPHTMSFTSCLSYLITHDIIKRTTNRTLFGQPD